MSESKLEARVADLERRLAELQRTVLANGDAQTKDWRSTVGMFTGDPIMERIDAFALAYREADRRRARRAAKRPRAKK
jgi:phage-related minor tail protein